MTSRAIFILAGVWGLSVAVAVHLLDFPGSVPDFQHASGGGTLLDAVPAFTSPETYARLDAYGPAGRKNYATRTVTVDVLLPLSVLPFLFLVARRAVAAATLGGVARTALLAMPFVYVIFDFIENGLLLALIAEYPNQLEVLPRLLPFITVIKRAASLLALALPLTLLAVHVARSRLRGAKGST